MAGFLKNLRADYVRAQNRKMNTFGHKNLPPDEATY